MISTEQVIPSSSDDNLGGYFWFFMGYLSFTPKHVGATYPRISLTETPLNVVDSIAHELNDPVCAIPSPCTLAEVRVCLFCGGVELGFWACRFLLGIDEEPTGILMTYSSMDMVWMGDSCSLEISITSGLLSMPHYPILTMHSTTLHLYSTTCTQDSSTVLGSTLFSLNLTTLNNAFLPCLAHFF